MNLRTALRVTLVFGWAGLLVEFSRTSPWVTVLIALSAGILWFHRSR